MSRFTPFCPKSETVHLTVQDIDASPATGSLGSARALCGRTFKVTGKYAKEAVPTFADEHERLSLTHETGLCRVCFDKQAELEGPVRELAGRAGVGAERRDPFTGRAPLTPEGNSRLGQYRIHHQIGL